MEHTHTPINTTIPIQHNANKHKILFGNVHPYHIYKLYYMYIKMCKKKGARMGGAKGAYVHHFRGGTLDSASCKNGFLDCATWQENHRPDTPSDWFVPD
jgi:hypothetical protein